MNKYIKHKLLLLLIFFSFNDIKSQSVFQTWPTIDLQGEVFDDLEIKLEYRNKYDNSSKESKQGRIDLGVAYKLKKILWLTLFLSLSIPLVACGPRYKRVTAHKAPGVIVKLR